MRWTRLVGSLLLAGCWAGSAQADDLLDVYYRALEHDPTYRSALYDHGIARASLREAYQSFLPTLEFQYEHIEEDQDVVSSDSPVFTTGQADFPIDDMRLTLTQPVFRFETIARLGQAKSEVRQAELEFLDAQQELMLRVAESYLGVLAAEDDLAFARAEREAIEQQLELVEERVDIGLAAVTDLHDANARHALARAEEIDARNRLRDSHQALREVNGFVLEYLKPLDESAPLDPPDPPDVMSWVRRALSDNLSLQATRAAADVGRGEIRNEQAGHMPTLDLVATYNDRDTDGSVFGGGSEVETTDFILRLNVPLFKGGRVRTRTHSARLAHEQMKRKVALRRMQVERETRTAFDGVMSGISRVAALKQSVISHQSALAAKQEGLSSGLNTTLAVLDAQRDLFLAKRDYAQGRYDFLLSRLRLKQAVGTLNEPDLVAVNQSLAARGRATGMPLAGPPPQPAERSARPVSTAARP